MKGFSVSSVLVFVGLAALVPACGGSGEEGGKVDSTTTTVAREIPERGIYTVKVPKGYDVVSAYRWSSDVSADVKTVSSEEYAPAGADPLTMERVSVVRAESSKPVSAVADAVGTAVLGAIPEGVEVEEKRVIGAEHAGRFYTSNGLYAAIGVRKIGTNDGTPAGVAELVIVRVFSKNPVGDPFGYINLTCGRESECSIVTK